MDDTVARYDPLEAIVEISQSTDLDMRTVAQVLEGEFDYMGCLGLLDEGGMDEEQRQEIDSLKRANEDILGVTDGEYEAGAAVLFIQRNRGIDKETIGRVLQANFRYMDERGFLDEDWGVNES
ncbi:MAG: hypothetical protein HGA98_03050 [Deltaproteobacteria bacterium]|nr:hypothetical protein [Deltaproteobacteria bacterium]